MVRINIVNHINRMTGVAERVAQPVNVHRVAAEMVRRIKCRQMQKI
jgi:hypothetical protein